MTAIKNLLTYTEDDTTEILNMINTTEIAHQDLVQLEFEKEIN